MAVAVDSPRPRAGRARVLVLALAMLCCAGFVALGSWQLKRRAWKHELIARVAERVHAPAAAAPGRDDWPQVSAARDEYRHVRVSGSYLHGSETLVQASTVLGSGYWVLTPLRLDDGSTVLVNRGYVPPERRDRATRSGADSAAPVTVTGLLRLTEPGGAFLRHNVPADNRWYSRDVQAIAAARGLDAAAPYFIDADAGPPPDPEGAPVGGLTVTVFADNHLVYALTWYALAAMVATATVRGLRTSARPVGAAA